MLVNLHKVVGRVRGREPVNAAENRDTEQFTINSLGDQMVTQGLPERASLVQLGNSYQVLSGTASGLTGIPTTAGLLTLWNGEQGGGNWLVIDSVQATKVVIDVTTIDLATIFAQVIRSPMAAPTDAALTIRSLNGRYSYGGRVRTVATSTTLANRWDVIGIIGNDAAAIGGSGWKQVDIDLLGRYLIPPGAAFTVHAAEVTNTAATFRFGIRWHEVMLQSVG